MRLTIRGVFAPHAFPESRSRAVALSFHRLHCTNAYKRGRFLRLVRDPHGPIALIFHSPSTHLPNPTIALPRSRADRPLVDTSQSASGAGPAGKRVTRSCVIFIFFCTHFPLFFRRGFDPTYENRTLRFTRDRLWRSGAATSALSRANTIVEITRIFSFNLSRVHTRIRFVLPCTSFLVSDRRIQKPNPEIRSDHRTAAVEYEYYSDSRLMRVNRRRRAQSVVFLTSRSSFARNRGLPGI